MPHVPQGVTSDGRQAGRVTSAVMSAAVGHSIALATLLRDFTEPGTSVILEDGTSGRRHRAPVRRLIVT